MVAQGNGAEAGAWFGKCNLMQTLRLHDDFIVECCAHTHSHTHTHARMCVSTYIYIWLTAAGALQTAADNAHTHSHTHSQIYLALLQLHRVLGALSFAFASMMLLNICIKNYAPYIVEYGKWSRSLPHVVASLAINSSNTGNKITNNTTTTTSVESTL